jgi:PadR family transcriptional regulator, regulatory protein PadR
MDGYLCSIRAMTQERPKVTEAVRGVLAVFMQEPSRELYGLELARGADVASGTLYPMLARFEQYGLVESRHEAPELFVGTGRPPRRYYRLTSRGAEWAHSALAPRHRTRLTPVAGRQWGLEGRS